MFTRVRQLAPVRHPAPARRAWPGPGRCASKSHDRKHLGLGGRRVQVSRHWSGKTLGQHRADRATVVREVLAEAGIAPPATDRLAADTLAEDGLPRYVWQPALVESADYANLVLASVSETVRWRREYETAKQRLTVAEGSGDSRASPRQPATACTGAVETIRQLKPSRPTPATTTPRPPDNQPAPGGRRAP